MEDVPGRVRDRRAGDRRGREQEDDMGMELWGPALDAEIAYRRESVEAGVRRERAARAARAPAPRDADATRVGRRRGRRWWLVGSGAWHAAR